MATSLARANLVLLALLVLHDVDHVANQPARHLAAAVVATGLLGIASVAGAAALSVRRHALAPLATVAVGVGNVAGFALVHLVPRWGAFSDPYSEFEPNALSWALIALPMLAGLVAGLAGLRAVSAARIA
ncbi:MAG: hypothetical protein ACRDJM_02500 [Actinomycetota bacterium]